jgi:hypothetical protein
MIVILIAYMEHHLNLNGLILDILVLTFPSALHMDMCCKVQDQVKLVDGLSGGFET